MNKLEVKYNKGNNALDPKKSPDKKNIYKKIVKHNKKRKKKKRKSISLIIFMIFILGISIIWRDAKVYTYQKGLANVNKEINNLQIENEALRVSLLKTSSIESIKELAEGNLAMAVPNKENVIRIANDKNIVLEEQKNEIKDEGFFKNFLNKIKNAFLN